MEDFVSIFHAKFNLSSKFPCYSSHGTLPRVKNLFRLLPSIIRYASHQAAAAKREGRKN